MVIGVEVDIIGCIGLVGIFTVGSGLFMVAIPTNFHFALFCCILLH